MSQGQISQFIICSDRALPGQNAAARGTACPPLGASGAACPRWINPPQNQSTMPAMSLASCFLPWMLP